MLDHQKAVLDIVRKQRNAIVDALEPLPLGGGTSTRRDIEQFIDGFANLFIEEVEKGSTELRDMYMDTVVPGLMKSGMPPSLLLQGAVQWLVVFTSEVDRSVASAQRKLALHWLAVYLGGYVCQLMDKAYEADNAK